jgi:ubiquinone/menaquinone biosynthesis C-methylase UbiE
VADVSNMQTKSAGTADPEVIRQYYDEKAPTYDADRTRGRFWRILDADERAIVRGHLVGCRSIIEVGAGTGRMTGTLLETADRVAAVDISPKMLAELRSKFPTEDRLETLVADVHRLDAVPGYGEFDALVSLRMLPHIADAEEILKIFRNAVRPGGTVIVDFWNRASYRYRKKRTAKVFNRFFTWDEIVRAIREAGLELTSVEGAMLGGPFDFSFRVLRRTWLRRYAYSLLAVCTRPND